jgi:uncharacterized membrane protein HdeD (DUF308 family)
MDKEISARSRLDMWWIPATAAIFMVAGGIAIILWPEISVRLAARSIGLILVVSGSILALSALFNLRVGYDWAVESFEALWALALGIPLLAYPETSVRALALVIGVLLSIGGLIKILSTAVLSGHIAFPGRYLLRGFAALALGGLLVFLPGASVTTVTIAVGAWMIVSGVLIIISALVLAGFGEEPERRSEII